MNQHPLRIHSLQHVFFEDDGLIGEWAVENHHLITRTALYQEHSFPNLDEIDLLIVMGGPMNIYEEDKYPWLRNEKMFLKAAIQRKTAILGICLGAQLLADCLGATITQNKEKEIGWFPVRFSQESNSIMLKGFPKKSTVMHWHGDTFEIPIKSIGIGDSIACPNQGFEYEGHVFGLQFHLESTHNGLAKQIANSKKELINGPFVQTEEQIMDGWDQHASRDLLYKLMGNITSGLYVEPNHGL